MLMPEVPPPANDAGPGPTAVSRPNVGLRLLAAYLGDGFNRAAPWQSGARLGLGVLPHQRVRIDLAYGFVGPGTAGGQPRLRVFRHEIGIDVGVGGDLGDRLTLHGTAVVAASFVRWRLEQRRGLRPIARVGPMLEIGIRLVAGLYLDIGVGAMVSLNRFAFVLCETPDSACTGEDRDVVASSGRVSPRGTVGLSYRFGRTPGR